MRLRIMTTPLLAEATISLIKYLPPPPSPFSSFELLEIAEDIRCLVK